MKLFKTKILNNHQKILNNNKNLWKIKYLISNILKNNY